jgi:hypothetical protein
VPSELGAWYRLRTPIGGARHPRFNVFLPLGLALVGCVSEGLSEHMCCINCTYAGSIVLSGEGVGGGGAAFRPHRPSGAGWRLLRRSSP